MYYFEKNILDGNNILVTNFAGVNNFKLFRISYHFQSINSNDKFYDHY